MNARCWRPALAAAFALCTVLAAAAADLRAYTEPLPPLNYEEAGEVRGFSTELLRAVAQRAGLSLEIRVLPWPRAVAMAQGDHRSVLYTLTRTAARENAYRWVGPIAKRRILLYRLPEREDVQVHSLDDMLAIRTAVARESATARMLAERGLGPQLEPALNDEASLRMLMARRVDAVAMLDFAAAWHAAHLEPGFRGLQPLIALDEEHEYYFGLHRDAPEALAARLQKALDGLRRDGELEQLTRHSRPSRGVWPRGGAPAAK